MQNICFICDFERLVFEKYCEGGMERHIEEDHNLWQYVFYMVHLRTKDASNHTGIESFVLHKFEDNEYSWMPRQKALCLQNLSQQDDQEQENEEKEELLRQ